MTLKTLDLLCDLIALPSVNPMGRSVEGPEYYEHQVTEYLKKVFQQLNVPFECQQLEPLRANIVARLDGNRDPLAGGELIVFEAHQDTVPVDGMTIPPWTPQIRDGRVYGRGACDIKGGMACMLAAFSRLAEQRPASMPTIIMACSANEEFGSRGAKDLARLWQRAESRLMPRIPDAVIVAEPTGLNVVVAHKGVMRWSITVHGRAAHSSRPDLGVNAAYGMAKVLNLLEQYAREVVGQVGNHPLVGSPTLSVGLISGGISINTVPDRCTIQVDRRVLPGENGLEARQHVVDYLQEHLPSSVVVDHDPPMLASSGLSDRANGHLAERLSETIRAFGHSGQCIGVPFGTNAPAYDAAGAPTVVFGPGSIAQAHTCDEWVEIDQLERATEILTAFGATGLNAERDGSKRRPT